MKLNLDKVTLLTFISIAFLSCSTKEIPVTPEVTEKITYVKNVKSIVDNSCATSSCHDAVGPAAGLKLTTYSEVKSSAQNGNFHARIDNDLCLQVERYLLQQKLLLINGKQMVI